MQVLQHVLPMHHHRIRDAFQRLFDRAQEVKDSKAVLLREDELWLEQMKGGMGTLVQAWFPEMRGIEDSAKVFGFNPLSFPHRPLALARPFGC